MGQPAPSLPVRAALIYGFGATSWILVSDWLLATMAGSAAALTSLQNMKGAAFVGVTSLLLYLALAHSERRRAQSEAARRTEELRAMAAEQAARVAAERAAARLASLKELSEALASALTSDEVLKTIVAHGTGAAGAASCVVGLLDASGEQLAVVAHSAVSPMSQATPATFRLDAPVPPTVALGAGETIWLRSREEVAARFPAFVPFMEQFGDEAHAALPLITPGRVSGVICLNFREPQAFSLDDQAFLMSMAQQTAQVLERTRLYAEVHDGQARLRQLSQRLLMAQEQERRHIARELHDEIGQVLGALKINLHLLQARDDPEASARRLSESGTMLDGLIQQVRALSLDLRPSVLDDLGLAAALEWYADRLARRSGLEVRVLAADTHALPPEVATACFRVVQEALTNVVRHARASQATVALDRRHDTLILAVQDDGVGFDVAGQRARASAGASLGLISMVERAELVGGWADISSTPGLGTEIWASFPLAPAPPEVRR